MRVSLPESRGFSTPPTGGLSASVSSDGCGDRYFALRRAIIHGRLCAARTGSPPQAHQATASPPLPSGTATAQKLSDPLCSGDAPTSAKVLDVPLDWLHRSAIFP